MIVLIGLTNLGPTEEDIHVYDYSALCANAPRGDLEVTDWADRHFDLWFTTTPFNATASDKEEE